MTAARQPHVPTCQAWGGAALVETERGLWLEALAPLAPDDLAPVEAALARHACVVLDLTRVGPEGIGLGLVQRLLAWPDAPWWGARPRRIVRFVAPAGAGAAMLLGTARQLERHADVASVPAAEVRGVEPFATLAALARPELERARAEVSAWTDVRKLLWAEPRTSFEAAAAHLGVSRRTLQRQLALAGTTFRDEQGRALVARAYERVVGSRDKLGVIAAEIGFASESQLSRAFRRRYGVSPNTLRKAEA